MIRNLFNKWFREQCKKAWYDDDHKDKENINMSINSQKSRRSNNYNKIDESIIHDNKCYNLKMQPASGGTVIQVSHYNENNDEWFNDLFVVPEDKNLGEEITSILVEYRLKHV